MAMLIEKREEFPRENTILERVVPCYRIFFGALFYIDTFNRGKFQLRFLGFRAVAYDIRFLRKISQNYCTAGAVYKDIKRITTWLY